MRLLDLFCGAGGASVGYHRAGFDVIGVDIENHDDYPFEFYRMDAIQLLKDGVPSTFDAIHASPPCQALTTMSNRWRGAGGKADSHINLIPAVRDLLRATGLPYIIENVGGARPHMESPLTLSGGAFGLRVNRPRLFESNMLLSAPKRVAVDNPIGVYGQRPDGRRLFDRKDGTMQRAAASLEEGAAAMGIDWMTKWEDVTEAIPPAYTEISGPATASPSDDQGRSGMTGAGYEERWRKVIRVNKGDLSLCGKFRPDKARACTLDAGHPGPHEWEDEVKSR